MTKAVAKFGRSDIALVICAVVFASYFVLFLPMLPQDTHGIARSAPLMLGIGLLIAVIGVGISVASIINVMRESALGRMVNIPRMVLGFVGLVIFGYSSFVLALITVSFMVGTSRL